jgi:hypothetical protein
MREQINGPMRRRSDENSPTALLKKSVREMPPLGATATADDAQNWRYALVG